MSKGGIKDPTENQARDKQNKSKKRTISLYLGKQPTPSQIKFRNKNLPIIAVDETGDMGAPSKDREDKRQSFTVVGALIKDRNQFVKTRERFPKSKKAKYNTITLEEGKPIFKSLATQDFIFFETHRSKKNPCFRDSQSKVRSYVEMVSDVIEKIDPGIPFDIVIDTPPVEATDELIELYRGRFEGKSIEWFEIRSDSADHVLQIHDFITGSVGDRVEGIVETEELYEMIRNKNVEEK